MKDWRVEDRPREKLLTIGPAALSDAELLSVLLNTGYKGCNALELACGLLEAAGGLRVLLSEQGRNICLGKGVGEAKYARVLASVELGRRYLGQSPKRGLQMKDPETVRSMLASRLRDRENEVFVVLFLDNRHRLLHYEEMFQGTIDCASVHPREVVRRAMHYNAAALIVAHNHPSGSSKPSQADQRITRQLRDALELIETRLVDHFVVGEKEVVSFVEQGLL